MKREMDQREGHSKNEVQEDSTEDDDDDRQESWGVARLLLVDHSQANTLKDNLHSVQEWKSQPKPN